MKALSLISGGFDSPIATYLMLKRGIDIVCIHFNNFPYTDHRQLNKTTQLVKRLSRIFNKKLKLYIIDHGKAQTKIIQNCNRRYQCVLCRRMMFRVAEKLAKKEKCEVLITGENIGQVASQTLDNLKATDKAVDIDILRPILCNDKNETMKLAREIDIYDICAQPSFCCKAVPKSPTTRAKHEIVTKEEKRIPVNQIIKESIKTAKIEVISA